MFDIVTAGKRVQAFQHQCDQGQEGKQHPGNVFQHAFRQALSVVSYDLEAELQGSLVGTDDNNEGIAAFLQKRKPEFKGKK